MDRLLMHYFRSLNELQKIIFQGYLDHHVIDEIALRKARNKLFHLLKKMRQKERYPIAQFEHLYEIIFSLRALQRRVVDQTVFAVCLEELRKISGSLTALLYALSMKYQSAVLTAMDEFSVAIALLDELYRTTLQVVSYEPIVFLFFIQTLFALHTEVEELAK